MLNLMLPLKDFVLLNSCINIHYLLDVWVEMWALPLSSRFVAAVPQLLEEYRNPKDTSVLLWQDENESSFPPSFFSFSPTSYVSS